jgi:hypothetical protein
MKKPRTAVRQNRSVRCAIYTRKSSEEGLEQEFNSLQAQREACEAFIDSQRHEGWVGLRAAYDDGGFSGATMDRPALQQLLADVTAGRVDTLVVYKIDRLTRSLADFAKIVEILDARGASFVSVTQQFNTTTSMGRLTLNVLRRPSRACPRACRSAAVGRSLRVARIPRTTRPHRRRANKQNNCGRRFAPGASHRDNGQSSSGRRREKAPASS